MSLVYMKTCLEKNVSVFVQLLLENSTGLLHVCRTQFYLGHGTNTQILVTVLCGGHDCYYLYLYLAIIKLKYRADRAYAPYHTAHETG